MAHVLGRVESNSAASAANWFTRFVVCGPLNNVISLKIPQTDHRRMIIALVNQFRELLLRVLVKRGSSVMLLITGISLHKIIPSSSAKSYVSSACS